MSSTVPHEYVLSQTLLPLSVRWCVPVQPYTFPRITCIIIKVVFCRNKKNEIQNRIKLLPHKLWLYLFKTKLNNHK